MGKHKVILKKSNVQDKIPNVSGMSYGELFINYASGDGKSFIALRKHDDTVAQFMEKKYVDNEIDELIDIIEENEFVVAAGLTDLNENVEELNESVVTGAVMSNSETTPSVTNNVLTIPAVNGPQGYQGPIGSQGNQGRQGYQGQTGPQGNQGYQGMQGYQGPIGPQGNQGYQGMQGYQGPIGPQGNQGRQGYQGWQGYQGPIGPQGNQGYQGMQGYQGKTGPVFNVTTADTKQYLLGLNATGGTIGADTVHTNKDVYVSGNTLYAGNLSFNGVLLTSFSSSVHSAINNAIANVYNVKGSTDSYETLTAKTNNTKGDVWNVVSSHGEIGTSGYTPAGTNYVWDGSGWDQLGGTVDLTGYATSADTYDSINFLSEEINGIYDEIDGLYLTYATKAEASEYAAAALANANMHTDEVSGETLNSAFDYTDELAITGAVMSDVITEPSIENNILTIPTVAGNQGYQGPTGPQGNQGVQGYQGLQGYQGRQGYQGPIGPQGNQGYQGYQGINSRFLYRFTDVLNAYSDMLYVLENSDEEVLGFNPNHLYLYTGGDQREISSYYDLGSVLGRQGHQGPIGPQGNQGYQGKTGPVFNVTTAGTKQYLLGLNATGGTIGADTVHTNMRFYFEDNKLHLDNNSDVYINGGRILLKIYNSTDGVGFYPISNAKLGLYGSDYASPVIITNVDKPREDYDAVNKIYVDNFLDILSGHVQFILSDYATKAESSEYAAAALANAMDYTDDLAITGSVMSDTASSPSITNNVLTIPTVAGNQGYQGYQGKTGPVFDVTTADTKQYLLGLNATGGTIGADTVHTNSDIYVIGNTLYGGEINVNGIKYSDLATKDDASEYASTALANSIIYTDELAITGAVMSSGTSVPTIERNVLTIPTINVTTASTMHYLIGINGINTEFNSTNVHSNTGVYMTNGTIYSASDENLKEFKGDIRCYFDELKAIPKKYFEWKSGDPPGLQIGTSAQELARYYPEVVSVDENGGYAVSYERLSIIALAAVDKLYEKIVKLEKEIDNLKGE